MDSVFDDGSKTWATVTNKLYAQTAPCLILQDVVNPGKVSSASDGNDLCAIKLSRRVSATAQS